MNDEQAGSVCRKGEAVVPAWMPAVTTPGEGGAAETPPARFGDCESRYRELLQTSPDLVFVMDPDGSLVFVNKAWQRHMGYAADEALGKSGLSLMDPESRPACRAALERANAGQHVQNIELRSGTGDGGHVDILVNLAPVYDAQEQVVQILGNGRDITELKRVQESLASSEERLRILFEYAPDACFLCDLMGTFLDGNKAAEELCGYRREELIGKSLLKLDLLPRKQLPKAAGYLARNATGRPVGPVEFQLRRKDGVCVQIEVRTYPVTIGKKNVILGTARNISDRKRAEEVLKESEEKFKVIFEEAHEGIAYLDGAGRVLDVNKKTVDILQRPKEQIVGKHFIELGILDAQDIPRLLNHFQQVRVESPLPIVSYERVPLTQVFQNLISNAVKYMDKPKGEIRVAATEDDKFWTFSIADNGPGIEKKYFDRIFQMFQTLAPSGSGDSTGIGLAVVKKIVQMHGGDVRVQSTPGSGSTFSFTVPNAAKG